MDETFSDTDKNDSDWTISGGVSSDTLKDVIYACNSKDIGIFLLIRNIRIFKNFIILVGGYGMFYSTKAYKTFTNSITHTKVFNLFCV